MRLDNFDIRLLRVFVAVVENGGFSAAQSRLGMGQSAISGKMGDLEDRLGMRLCERGRKGFSLTEEGRQVYDTTLKLLGHIAVFEEEAASIGHATVGHIRMGIIDTVATNPECCLQEGLRQFSLRYPKVSINLAIMETTEIEAALLQGRLDVGICSSELEMDGLSYRRLFGERQRLYAAPDHPVFALSGAPADFSDLLDFQIIGRGKAYGVTPLDGVHGLRTRADSAHMEGTVFLILSGEYIGYLPEHYARVWVEQGRLHVLENPAFDYLNDFSLTLPRYGHCSVACSRMLDELLAAHGLKKPMRPSSRKRLTELNGEG